MASNALKSLMSDNPRYKAMFDVDKEYANSGIDLSRDYTEDMNRLRDAAPVHKGSLRALLGAEDIDYNTVKRPSYTFFSYRACEIGFRENLLFSSEGYNESPGVRSVGTTILSMVGKPHKRLRSAAQPLFKRPKVLNWWNKRWIEETVDALLDRLLDEDAVDLNTELCARLPMATVTRAIVDKTLRNLIAENTHNPGDNLIAGLIAAEIVDEEDGIKRKLTEDEIFGYCKLAIFAGGGTTWRQLGITIDALMNHRHFWDACRQERHLIDLAVEESLRWRATDPVFTRVSTADSEVEGVFVPEGMRIHLCLAAANHDPAVFERPGEYDIFRKKEHHMGFGFGPHRCLGMDVARQEMIVAIAGLMDRFPNMRLDPDRPRPEYRGLDHRGMTAVTVRLK